MIQVRKSQDRGHFDHGWLDTYHTFSFSSYYDADQMGFRSLRVINEDRVAAGQGFGKHGHRDMEIITYVLDGELEHQDSMGNGEILRAGEFQRMTAGSGIQHSEFNPSQDSAVHLYQIWLLPAEAGLTPSYDQRRFDEAESTNRFGLVASGDPRDSVLTIQQDARLYLGRLAAGCQLTQRLAAARYGWLQVLRGALDLNGSELTQGDGAAIRDETELMLSSPAGAEVLLFDLA